jgi:hypothetical protein
MRPAPSICVWHSLGQVLLAQQRQGSRDRRQLKYQALG